MLQIDIELFGVYIPGVEGPQAQFRSFIDASDWGRFKYGDEYEIKLNYARWTTEEEQKELEDYERTKKS